MVHHAFKGRASQEKPCYPSVARERKGDESRFALRVRVRHCEQQCQHKEDDGVAALSGWRNEVFGKDAVALRNGDLAIALEKGEAVVVELE